SGKRRCAGERVAAERAAEAANASCVHHFGAAGHRGQWQTTAERFSGSDEVRLDAVMFTGEIFTGARDAGLHFVGTEEDAVLSADLVKCRVNLRWRSNEAAFA